MRDRVGSKANRFLLILGAVSAVLVLYFHQEESANPLSRLLPVYALVEDHTLVADRWGAEAYDKAIIEGHVYGEKAPLSSLLMLPFYWLMRLPSHAPQSAGDRAAAIHMGNVVCGAIPFAVLVVLIFLRVMREKKVDARTGTWIAMACGFSSFLFNYGGCNFGHMLAATVLLGSYVLAVDRQERFGLAGFLGGCSVLAEYPVILLQVMIVLYLLVGEDRSKRVGRYLLGAAPCALFLLIYNAAVTGNPFDSPYSHIPTYFTQGRPQFSWPSLQNAYELLLGQYRGAAVFAPVLFLFLPLLALKSKATRRRKQLIWGAGLLSLTFVSAYYQWDGGWCTGPRQLAVITAVFLYEGAGVLAENLDWMKVFNPLAIAGIAINLLAVGTNPCPPEAAKHPIFEVWWVRFVQGATADSILSDLGASRGQWQLYLWVGLFAVAVVQTARLGQRWYRPPAS